MRGATYNQLLIFHAIVEEGSIRGAARKLELAPPSVSNALKALEANLELPLLVRTTRSMELTEAGRLLYDNTTAAVLSLNTALETVHDLSREPTGKVRLTLPKFVYDWLLKPIYADFCQLYPDIQLEVVISDATMNLVSENIDIGIRFGHKVEEGMVAKQLTHSMKEALFASECYLERYGVPQTLEELAKHRMIQYRFITSNQLAPLVLEKGANKIEVKASPAVIVNDTDMMVDAARKGLGIGRIVEPIVTTEFDNKQLIPVLKQYWATYPGLFLYFPQNSQRAKRVRVLVDFLIKNMQ
ncbi:LysR family transcriptional regulator [Sessilibacter corallicola]|uniref:LysR family transcriptional regulator n=1 Tax=Sessilibacter corallicola TaxID=2904075 RepID=A0ABQ0A721_9GAMM